ncbi:MAG: protein kinase [Chloroflexi bacterium]|nr:protein kinase [Chloroflexota bacterium]
MSALQAWQAAMRRLWRQHRPLLSFHDALEQAGGTAGAVDRGIQTIPVDAIVGSIGRWQALRSDFLYRTGKSITQRFYRVGTAMLAGKPLPAIDVYKLKFRSSRAGGPPQSEYYVLDGHHRVAMARRLGQAYLDAHVVEYVGRTARQAHSLRQVDLFRDAPAADLEALWQQLSEIQFPTGALICQRGERGAGMYIVKVGSVEVRLGHGADGTSLYRLGPGDAFGEMALLTGEPRSADVVAIEDTTTWVLEQSAFEQVLSQSIPLLRAMNRSLAQRLAMATTVIDQTRFGGAGLRFGPFRVVAQLGAGGMAVVYSAVREDDGQAVALKVLPASWGNAPQLRARLEREAAVLQRVQHPGIIRVVRIGSVSGTLGGGTYIAMEWLPDALDRLIRVRFPRTLELEDSLRIASGVADALAAVHAQGLVHRDVKPSNILLRANGQPVLTDFGLAAALVEQMSQHRLTPPETLVGTADYLAPETILGQAVDGRTDIYALGIVLYEMLAGYVPYAGREPFQVLRAHCEEAGPPLPPEVPEGVRGVVARALEKEPSRRFATAAEFADALRGVS